MSKSSPTSPPPFGNLGPVLFLVAGFALIDLIAPAVIEKVMWGEGEPFVVMVWAVFLGAIVGQCGFLAFWAVLGPHRLLVRFSAALVAAGSLYCVFLVGIILAVGPPPDGILEVASGALLLPLLSLAPQGPIWILKWAMGCRMMARSRIPASAVCPFQRFGGEEDPGGDEDPGGEEDPGDLSSARQFTLGQILVTTTFVAVAFGLASSFVKINMRHGPPGWEWEMWAGVFIAFGMIFIASALVALPCIVAALMIRNRGIGVSVFAAHTGVLWLAPFVWAGSIGGRVPGEAILAVLLFVSSMTGTLFGGLQVIRLCGYELMWPGRLRRDIRARDTKTGPETAPGDDATEATANDVQGMAADPAEIPVEEAAEQAPKRELGQ